MLAKVYRKYSSPNRKGKTISFHEKVFDLQLRRKGFECAANNGYCYQIVEQKYSTGYNKELATRTQAVQEFG